MWDKVGSSEGVVTQGICVRPLRYISEGMSMQPCASRRRISCGAGWRCGGVERRAFQEPGPTRLRSGRG